MESRRADKSITDPKFKNKHVRLFVCIYLTILLLLKVYFFSGSFGRIYDPCANGSLCPRSRSSAGGNRGFRRKRESEEEGISAWMRKCKLSRRVDGKRDTLHLPARTLRSNSFKTSPILVF